MRLTQRGESVAIHRTAVGRSVSVVTGLLALLTVLSCSSPLDVPSTDAAPLVEVPRATPTPLAVEATVDLSGPFYRPPSWDGVSDVDCTDFDTQEHAQSFFVGTHGSKTNDPYRLDADGDGIACESSN